MVTWLEFLDGKLARLAMTANCFVDSPIGTRTDEADDFISVDHSHLALVANAGTKASVCWI
jgi:phosphatidylglycerophosphate synthase